jgi:hypothetical protein
MVTQQKTPRSMLFRRTLREWGHAIWRKSTRRLLDRWIGVCNTLEKTLFGSLRGCLGVVWGRILLPGNMFCISINATFTCMQELSALLRTIFVLLAQDDELESYQSYGYRTVCWFCVTLLLCSHPRLSCLRYQYKRWARHVL